MSYPMARPRAGAARTNLATPTVGATAMSTPTTSPTLAPRQGRRRLTLEARTIGTEGDRGAKAGEGARLGVEVAARQLNRAFGQFAFYE